MATATGGKTKRKKRKRSRSKKKHARKKKKKAKKGGSKGCNVCYKVGGCGCAGHNHYFGGCAAPVLGGGEKTQQHNYAYY